MAKRAVHWYEGMFLRPQHFQAADRFARDRVREAEDWLRPYHWGLRSIEFNEDAIANYSLVVRSCQARFKDGTTVNIPEEATLAPVDLRAALARGSDVTVYLALPIWHEGRANIETAATANGPRYLVNAVERVDENTGADETPIEFRHVQPRLLLSTLDMTGYELLPIARIIRSSTADAPPRIDRAFTPPLLGVDAWAPLQEEVRGLHEQMGAHLANEAATLVGRKIAFDSQILGDAERVLRLSYLNTSFSAMQSVVATRGMHPIDMYRELARLLGHLSIFDDSRRPIDVPTYDHENIGPIYALVIREIRRLLGMMGRVNFVKRYFQLDVRWFQVRLEKDWLLDTTKAYVGVPETTEMTDAECDELMTTKLDWKLGSGDKVEEFLQRGIPGLRMKPLGRIPPALPAGVVYFEIERNPLYWQDVLRTLTLGLRFKLDRGKFLSKEMLAFTHPKTQQPVNVQFAVYVVLSS